MHNKQTFYDYSYLKKLPIDLFNSVNDLLKNGESDDAFCKLIFPLFEKSLKYILIKDKIIDSSDVKRQFMPILNANQRYLENILKISLDFIYSLNDQTNIGKHAIESNSYSLQKDFLLKNLFIIFVYLNNNRAKNAIKVEIPSDDEISSLLLDYEEKRKQEVDIKLEDTNNQLKDAEEQLEKTKVLINDSVKNSSLATISNLQLDVVFNLAKDFLNQDKFNEALDLFDKCYNANLFSLTYLSYKFFSYYNSKNVEEMVWNIVINKRDIKQCPFFHQIALLKEDDKKVFNEIEASIDFISKLFDESLISEDCIVEAACIFNNIDFDKILNILIDYNEIKEFSDSNWKNISLFYKTLAKEKFFRHETLDKFNKIYTSRLKEKVEKLLKHSDFNDALEMYDPYFNMIIDEYTIHLACVRFYSPIEHEKFLDIYEFVKKASNWIDSKQRETELLHFEDQVKYFFNVTSLHVSWYGECKILVNFNRACNLFDLDKEALKPMVKEAIFEEFKNNNKKYFHYCEYSSDSEFLDLMYEFNNKLNKSLSDVIYKFHIDGIFYYLNYSYTGSAESLLKDLKERYPKLLNKDKDTIRKIKIGFELCEIYDKKQYRKVVDIINKINVFEHHELGHLVYEIEKELNEAEQKAMLQRKYDYLSELVKSSGKDFLLLLSEIYFVEIKKLKPIFDSVLNTFSLEGIKKHENLKTFVLKHLNFYEGKIDLENFVFDIKELNTLDIDTLNWLFSFHYAGQVYDYLNN